VSSTMAEESCDSFSYNFDFTSRAALKNKKQLLCMRSEHQNISYYKSTFKEADA
jgi:hypothetical protein